MSVDDMSVDKIYVD
jgi:hypothetical protein